MKYRKESTKYVPGNTATTISQDPHGYHWEGYITNGLCCATEMIARIHLRRLAHAIDCPQAGGGNCLSLRKSDALVPVVTEPTCDRCDRMRISLRKFSLLTRLLF